MQGYSYRPAGQKSDKGLTGQNQSVTGLVPPGGSREEVTPSPFLASRGCLHRLAFGPFYYLQSRQSSIIRSRVSSHLKILNSITRAQSLCHVRGQIHRPWELGYEHLWEASALPITSL